ncbi:MAG: 16S rRNA (cytosine(1402)-N(4))-methyltransferase RsmH [Dysgonamonadaceae bacterium]|nr:16S rRNA (cytosine(1402)-N(4))-methyltransferase RsmH [Dysgonamonadaceae bacterium]MDD4728797.1 16S rRNA (cytosine(1402)-N(4))-methyltransferase RsmH [Dysgonamonadaceae bacterium]
MTDYHIPALLEETIDGLNIQSDGIYVDTTFGGGGHAKEILARLGKNGRLFGFDQDIEAYENTLHDERFVFVRSNFRYLKNFLKYYGVEKVNGILGDLGVSSHHFDDEERGFSFRYESQLDMRMNLSAKQTAADILNNYDEEQLSRIFYMYGELRMARKIASSIVFARRKNPITTVNDFLEIIERYTQRDKERKILAQAFQALRIEVNQELDALSEMLQQSKDHLAPEGRLCIISYHSLEDRVVKNFFRSGNFEGKIVKDFYGNPITDLKVINRKVIIPTEEEQRRNPRSRSAKLRIAEKLQL